jgi:predicted DNA-binding protein (UPF0251 family)
MHPALATLTAIEAARLAENLQVMADWTEEHGVDFGHDTRSYIMALAKQAPPPPAPPPLPTHPRRPDADELRDLLIRAERLPPMVKVVGKLTLFQGLSLTQAARHLGISRETVRSHMRRLRAVNETVKERRARREAHAAWLESLRSDQTERSRGMR